MKSNKDHISWCLKQRRGIKVEVPNVNLTNVYLKKARSSLNILNSALEKDEVDWIATTAYYARYFALYALLQKCGIKSEIHDCTISLMKYLFVDENIIENKFYDELKLAKELRVDVQYYVAEELDRNELRTDSVTAQDFVLKMEEVIENISKEQVELVRNKITE